MRFPVSLFELCEQEKQMKFSDAIALTRYAEIVEIKRDKIKMSKVVMFYMFGQSIERTVKHVKSLFKDKRITNVSLILMVGGYSESPLLQEAVQEAFPEMRVVIPQNPSSTVLRGALIFGHKPLVVSERILKYTYGVDACRPFIEGVHEESKRVSTDKGDRCTDLFSVFVSKYQAVKTGETQVKKRFITANKFQRGMHFTCFISEKTHPLYVDEVECIEIGDLLICFEVPDENVKRGVNVSIAFGGTEIIVEAEDEKTGDKTRSKLDFLG